MQVSFPPAPPNMKSKKRNDVPNPGHSRELQADMLDGQRLRQTKYQSALQMGAGSLLLVAAEDDVFIVQSGKVISSAFRADNHR